MNRYLPLAIITVAEATIGIFVKLAGNAVPIYTLNFYRMFFALLLLLAVMPFVDRGFWRVNRGEAKPIIIIGGLIALQISLFNIAMSMAPIANVVVLWSTYPFVVFLLSARMKEEQFRKIHIPIFLLALVGILVAEPLSGGTITGNLISLFGGIVYGSLISYMRYEQQTESSGAIFWFILAATMFLFPALFIFGSGSIFSPAPATLFGATVTVPAIVWVASLGVISTGVSYLFIAYALKRIPAGVYSLVDVIVSPVVAAFFGLIILSEMPPISMVYGGAIVLTAGFWLATDLSRGRITRLDYFQRYYSSLRENWFTRLAHRVDDAFHRKKGPETEEPEGQD